MGTAITLKAHAFDLSAVRLLPGLFKQAQELDKKYLLSLDLERLLHNFRVTAGLPSSAECYGGWEHSGCELRGHFVGHFLSACALMYAGTGDKALKEKADYMVTELGKCQGKLGNGYLSAFPEEFLDRVEQGKQVWAPWYTLHKIFAGMLDMQLYCGNSRALEISKKMGNWAIGRTDRLSDEQMNKMLEAEFGGMNDVLARLYEVTSEEKYLKLARRFYHHSILDSLSEAKDNLNGLHANTQIPKVLGTARVYELTGDKKMKDLSDFFWQAVTKERSYAPGGNSNYEHFAPKEHLSQEISEATMETCNTYNMLKLTEKLFCQDANAEYAAFYERALYNHILASQNPENGMMSYFVSLKPGFMRNLNNQHGFCTPFDSFWCCTGTGVENHARYGAGIYFHEGDKVLYVNLFIPSTLDWKTRGVRLRQETRFPQEPSTKLIIQCDQPEKFTLNLRHPSWSEAGLQVTVNGEKAVVESKPGGYAILERTWNNGDTVQVQIPMRLTVESFKDNPHRMAILYGPLVLCGQVDPDKTMPVIVGQPSKIFSAMRPAGGKPLTFMGTPPVFRLPGALVSGGPEITLMPFYQSYDKPVLVYWDQFDDEEEWSKRQEEYKAEQVRQRSYEARIVDRVAPGEPQPERDHQLRFKGECFNGEVWGHKWRAVKTGGWFSYEMQALPDKPLQLVCNYWGHDNDREIEVYVDETKVAVQKLTMEKPLQLIEKTYEIPFEVTRGKERVRVKFAIRQGKSEAGVYGVRIMRSEEN